MEIMKTTHRFKQKIVRLWPHLDERTRRMVAASEAAQLGLMAVSRKLAAIVVCLALPSRRVSVNWTISPYPSGVFDRLLRN